MIATLIDGKALWYLSRGSGAVTLLLLTASLTLGVVTTIGWTSSAAPRFVIQTLHRNISLMVMVFLVFHAGTSIIDGYVHLGWLDTVVPFTAGYRPIWVGLGAATVDLLLAVIVTSLLRVHIRYETWRSIHWFSYASWPIAVVHGLGTGSDTRSSWMLVLVGFCTLIVLLSVLWRLRARRPKRRDVAIAAVVASIVAPR